MPHDHGHEEKPKSGLGLAAQMEAISKGETPHDHGHHENPPHGAPGHVCGGHGHHSANDNGGGDDPHHHDHSEHKEHDHHDHGPKKNYNHGILKFAFSKVSGAVGERLNKHRRKIVLGAAAATAVAEYAVTKSTMASSVILLFAGAAVAHDASEDIMEVTGELKESQNLSSGVVGTAVGATHTLSEGVFSLLSSVQGNSDIAVSSVMGSNASHILLMAGGAAVIGKVGAGQSNAWKLHTAGIAGLTGAFAYQITTGEFNPVLGGAMAAGGLYYLYQRVSSGETCVIHGDACGGHHHDHDEHVTPKLDLTLRQRLTDPKLLQLGGSVVALTASAHVLGHQVLAQAQNMGISETSAGAGIAALALAAPEIILTWKAAHKGDSDMAWGAITGCTVATVGIVGGGLAMAGVDVPINLDPTTTEGRNHMLAFAGSAAAIVGVTHPWVVKKISNDGASMPKWVGAGFLAAATLYYANNTQPNCDYHGSRLHCFGSTEQSIDYNEPLQFEP